MKARCLKNPEHKRFETVIHITEYWEVDEEGNFIDHRGNGEVTHGPDKGNTWICLECETEAVVED